MRGKLAESSRLTRFLGKRLRTICVYYLISALPFILVSLSLSIRMTALRSPARFWRRSCRSHSCMRAPLFAIYVVAQANPYVGFFGLSKFISFDIGAGQFLFVCSIVIGAHSKTILDRLAQMNRVSRFLLFALSVVLTVLLRGWSFYHPMTAITYPIETNVRFQLHLVHLVHIAAALLAFTILLTSQDRIFRWLSLPLRTYFSLFPIANVGKWSIQMFTLHVFLLYIFTVAEPFLDNSEAGAAALAVVLVFIPAPSLYALRGQFRPPALARSMR